jgi:transcription initiation factor TFIID subunit 6
MLAMLIKNACFDAYSSHEIAGCLFSRYGDAYVNLQPRISKTLLQAFLDPKRAMTQHYGSIKGLAALGPRVVKTVMHILTV